MLSLQQLDDRYLTSAWNPFTFVNSWANVAGNEPCQFRKLPSGLVVIEGTCNGGSSVVVTTLPVGYRPAGNLVIACLTTTGGTNAAGYVLIQSSTGAFSVQTLAAGLPGTAYFSLSYIAEQ